MQVGNLPQTSSKAKKVLYLGSVVCHKHAFANSAVDFLVDQKQHHTIKIQRFAQQLLSIVAKQDTLIRCALLSARHAQKRPTEQGSCLQCVLNKDASLQIFQVSNKVLHIFVNALEQQVKALQHGHVDFFELFIRVEQIL
jgi:hypothetical protein